MQLVLSGGTDMQQAADFIKSQQYVAGVGRDDHTLSVTLNDGKMSPVLLKAVVNADIGVEEARRMTRSLEDVYLEIMQEAKN